MHRHGNVSELSAVAASCSAELKSCCWTFFSQNQIFVKFLLKYCEDHVDNAIFSLVFLYYFLYY